MSDAVQFDARGLSCPLPILRARRMLRDLGEGQTLAIVATDPGTMADFQSFCQHAGHRLLESFEDDSGLFHYLIRKGTA